MTTSHLCLIFSSEAAVREGRADLLLFSVVPSRVDRGDRAPADWLYLFILLVVLQRYTLAAIIFQVVAGGDLQQQCVFFKKKKNRNHLMQIQGVQNY